MSMVIKRGRSEIESPLGGLQISGGRVFACKTCNREFPSFQALGGHRASHKKIPKLFPSSSPNSSSDDSVTPATPPKPKTHECSICGLEFAIGQALGGHMRRHRQEMAGATAAAVDSRRTEFPAIAPVPVLMKSSSKRVCLDLDLELHLGPPGSYNLSLQLKTPC